MYANLMMIKDFSRRFKTNALHENKSMRAVAANFDDPYETIHWASFRARYVTK